MRTLRRFARLLGIDTIVGVFRSIWINLCNVVSLSLEKNDFCLRAILRLSFTTVASIGNGRRMQTEKAVWHDKRAWISITKILKMQPPSPIKRLISEKHLFCQNNEWLLIITKRYDMTFRFFEKAHVWLSAVFLWLAKDLEEPLKIFVYPRWSENLSFPVHFGRKSLQRWLYFFFQCSLDVNHYRDDLEIPWRKQLKNNWKSIDDCIFSFKYFNCFINQPGWLTIEVLYPLLILRKDFTAMHKYEEDHLS